MFSKKVLAKYTNRAKERERTSSMFGRASVRVYGHINCDNFTKSNYNGNNSISRSVPFHSIEQNSLKKPMFYNVKQRVSLLFLAEFHREKCDDRLPFLSVYLFFSFFCMFFMFFLHQFYICTRTHVLSVCFYTRFFPFSKTTTTRARLY